MNVANRQKIERRIARRIVRDAIEMGYTVTINNGGDEDEIENCADIKEAQAALMASDEDMITFAKNGERIGSAYLVYGNDGWDVISDYSWRATGDSTEVDAILANAQRIADEEEKAWA